jgi:hypothetical protein
LLLCSGIPCAADRRFVIEHPSRTCSAQMRIRIPSRVRLGTRAAPPDREYRACAVSFNSMLVSGISVCFSSLSFFVLSLPFFTLT